MYHVETIDIGKKHPMFSYLDHACLWEYKRNPGQTGQRARVCPVSA